ncbi:MAG: methylmalonyl-CoA mutase family protein [Thermonemataceae bacterium]|nr:methylmalonyl-CoA mutase family protein [Thermonemataceae bacterium]
MLVSDFFKEFSAMTPKDWQQQIEKDLKGIDLLSILHNNYEQIPLKAFYTKEDVNALFAEQLLKAVYQKFVQPKKKHLSTIVTDYICETFELGLDFKEDKFDDFLENIKSSQTNFHLHIDLFHNAGANAVQEIAYALALAGIYTEKLREKGLTIADIASRMTFVVAVGSNYFMEIAKFRVFYWLFAKLLSKFDENIGEIYPFVIACTAKINKSKRDAYNNLIRASLEVAAATTAKVDDVMVFPYDEPLDTYDEFSERIAENIRRVLTYESKLDFPIDAAAGSYFLEYISEQLARKSWAYFQQIDEIGGLVAYYRKGQLKKSITEIALKKVNDFQQKKLIQIGVNKYPNATDTIKIEPKNLNFFDSKAITTFRLEDFMLPNT